MKSLFELLAKARKARRVSAITMANDLDMSKSSVYRYEQNKFKTFSLVRLCRIAIYLHVPLADVLDALRKDNFPEDELRNAAEIYENEHIKKFGFYNKEDDDENYQYKSNSEGGLTAASSHLSDVLQDVDLRYHEGLITSKHVELIRFVANGLSDKEADKALRALRVIYDENI